MAKGGEPDPDCPNDLESMRFWCFVAKKEDTLEATRMKVQVQGQVNAAHALQAFTAASPSFTTPVPDVNALMNTQPALPVPGTPQAAAAVPARRGLRVLYSFVGELSHVSLPAGGAKAKAQAKAKAKGTGPLGLALAGKSLKEKIGLARTGLSAYHIARPFLDYQNSIVEVVRSRKRSML